MSDEVDPHLDGISDVLNVALCQRRQFDACAIVQCRATQRFPVDAVDYEVELAIVDEQVHARFDVIGNVGV